MTKLLTNVLTTALAALLLPTTGFASSILSFSNLPTSSGTVDLTNGIATVNLNSYNLNGTNNNATSGAQDFFTETYDNNTGVLTISGTASSASGPLSNLANITFLTIDESAGLLSGQSFPLSGLSLFSGVTSVTFDSSGAGGSSLFLQDLGITGSAGIANGNVSVSTGGSGNTGSASVTSTTTSFTFVATPEPSSFSMLGIVMLVGAGAGLRRKLEPARDA